MTKQRISILIMAGLAAAYGLPSVAMSFAIDDATPFFRITSLAVGILLMFGAISLVLGRRWSVPALWLSALIYAGVMLVPAFYRHGLEAFSVLMSAFYVSLAMRLALAAAAHLLLKRSHG